MQKAVEPENDAGFPKHNYSQLNCSCYSYPSKPRFNSVLFRLHIYGISKWLYTHYGNSACEASSPYQLKMAAPAEVSKKKRSNFLIRQFYEKRHFNIAANLTLNTMVSFIIHLIARTARIACPDRQTDRQNDKPSTVTLAAHARRGLMQTWVLVSSRNAYQILKVHLTSLEETKNTSLTLISRFYYLQLPNVVDQLLQPLVLPLIHHGAVYGTLPWTKELKALASCRRFLRNSAVQAHVSSVRYVILWCPVIAHAWNMLVQTTQVKWRTFHTIILFPFL